jgi:hypothetical protein
MAGYWTAARSSTRYWNYGSVAAVGLMANLIVLLLRCDNFGSTAACLQVTTCSLFTEYEKQYKSRCWPTRIVWIICLDAFWIFNPLKPNDPYRGRTAPLTSKRCILYIYSTNIFTEYFKHGIYSPFFSLQNAVCFIILTYLVPVLFTFYIQECKN